jgi:breast cancer 2 susceptibility protein
MILCISDITTETVNANTRTLLELTDGWYRIKANIDDILSNAAQQGRLFIGQKISIFGCQVHLLQR